MPNSPVQLPHTCKKKRCWVISCTSSSSTFSGKNLARKWNVIGESFGTSWSKTYMDLIPTDMWAYLYVNWQTVLTVNQHLTRLSGFSQAYVSFTIYLRPKNHVSLSPMVRHTRSNRSFPFHFTWETQINVKARKYGNIGHRNKQTNTDTLFTSQLNSISASMVITLTLKVFGCFFFSPKMDIFTFKAPKTRKCWCQMFVYLHVNKN